MGGLLPAPAVNRLGWAGQPPVTLGRTGSPITLGNGLVGRTIGGQLYLDAGRDIAAEAVSFFVPGVVTARTIGRWRNRRATSTALLGALEANLLTAPTAGDAANYWRLTCTDSAGATVVLPLSVAGQAFYDLDQVAGVALIDPWSGKPVALNYGDSSMAGARFAFVPTQNMALGGVSFSANVTATTTTLARRVRAQLHRQEDDGTWSTMATAYAYTKAGQSSSTFDRLAFVWPLTQPVVAGRRYFHTIDIFEVWESGQWGFPATQPRLNLKAPDYNDAVPNAGTPANLSPAGQTDTAKISVDVSKNPGGDGAIRALTWPALAASPVGTQATDFAVAATIISAGMWAATGTASGTAPLQGDLTFGLSLVGAPAAGAAGADLNFRALLLP